MAGKSFREDIRRKVHEEIMKKQEKIFIAPPTNNLPKNVNFDSTNAAEKAVIENSIPKPVKKSIK